MFFGRQIQSNQSVSLSDNKSQFQTIQITNAALSKFSLQAELYLNINDQEILVCAFNRNMGILQNSLNLLVDLKNSPALISRSGNIYVCGYYQAVNSNCPQNEARIITEETVTTKKVNSLADRFRKAETLPAQTAEVSLSSSQKPASQITPQQTFTPRVSSRLSSRRQTMPNPQPLKPATKTPDQPKQKQSKKQKKSQKKSGKSGTILSNGRYSLKALLQNISDDDDSDQESDEEFQNSGEDEESDDDDSEFGEDEQQQEEQLPKQKAKQSSDNGKNMKRVKSEDEIKERPKRQKIESSTSSNQNEPAKVSNPSQTNTKSPIEIIEEPDDEKESNTEEYQEKWPENPECYIEAETKREKMIQELASKLKVPTKKPSF